MTGPNNLTPPPELVPHLWAIYHRASIDDVRSAWTASVNAAYRTGADQQLEACCDYIGGEGKWFANPEHRLAELRAAMRPQPPSLKEQALDNLNWLEAEANYDKPILDTIRRALEQLP
jgi:hypothetical protein